MEWTALTWPRSSVVESTPLGDVCSWSICPLDWANWSLSPTEHIQVTVRERESEGGGREGGRERGREREREGGMGGREGGEGGTKLGEWCMQLSYVQIVCTNHHGNH